MLHIYKIVKTSNSLSTETDCAIFSNKENAIKALNGIFKFNHNIDYTYQIKSEEFHTDDEHYTPPTGCRIDVDFDNFGHISNLVYDITTDPDIVDDKDYFIINKNHTFGEGYITIRDGETPEQYRERVISFINLVMQQQCCASA
jgi:hypothetical protein